MKFHLSVVATTRNDNHGGSLTYRMQKFVDGFAEQCQRHALNAELILVEWNPPSDTPPLSEALKFPTNNPHCTIRIITVPLEVHQKLNHADHLPLFQMIGKNVGIQRARGKFVLATNIDILFSDQLIQFIRDKLKPGVLYRTDRLDVPNQLPSSENFRDILRFCEKNYFRINGKYGTLTIKGTNFIKNFFYSESVSKWFLLLRKTQIKRKTLTFIDRLWTCRKLPLKLAKTCILLTQALNNFRKSKNKYLPLSQKIQIKRKILAFINWLYACKKLLLRCVKICIFLLQRPKRPPSQRFKRLHLNGCGDFTLLSSEDWKKLRGYPEWEMFSWHIDSVFLFQAHQSGIKEIDLNRRMSIYHIEHGIGSGYTPEGVGVLFKRLDEKGVKYLSDSHFKEIVAAMKSTQSPILYNSENWGLAHLCLKESQIY